MARLIHQAGTASAIGWGGKSIEPGDDGVFDVPDEAVAELFAHGFVPEPPKPNKKGKADGGAS